MQLISHRDVSDFTIWKAAFDPNDEVLHIPWLAIPHGDENNSFPHQSACFMALA